MKHPLPHGRGSVAPRCASAPHGRGSVTGISQTLLLLLCCSLDALAAGKWRLISNRRTTSTAVVEHEQDVNVLKVDHPERFP